MKLRRTIQEYFSFSKGERIGLIVLIIIVCFLLLVNRIVFYFEEPTLADQEAFDSMLAKMDEMKREQVVAPLELFPFDPNLVDSSELVRLNLPWNVKSNMLKYTERGGQFINATDLRKIYGMNDSIYAAIESFIKIEQTERPIVSESDFVSSNESRKVNKASFAPVDLEEIVSKAPIQIDINKAEAVELERLTGIGPVLSKRIVKYRNLLGGFVVFDQLCEVYGVKPEVVKQNLNNLKLDSVEVRKIDLNFATVEELAGHPYINYKEARQIVDFRSKKGYISDNNILLTDSIIGIEKFQKLRFYLK